MSSQNLSRTPVLAGTLALCLSSGVSIAFGEPLSLAEDQARYAPIQSINYEIGSKAVSGYFVAQAASCLVTLMIIEKSDPEEPLAQTAARVRLILSPGQVAGLDSEEGRSLNFTCAENAALLLVDLGERATLVERQAMQHRKLVSDAQRLSAAAVAAEKN